MVPMLAALPVAFVSAEDTKDDPAKGAVVTLADLEDYVAKVGDFTVNNLVVKETPDERTRRLRT
jgi:hypothetical protein